eukprot:CAMPEP_0119120778 /NCGR_PEP_ID=MMETSP1310-20130426/1683_1 /TAXON_ID=464262 /ORGANISM="Genus nov. species nov., Strain RCC2339" /LENGTH=207 /DNA_ID=CAMNT_0007110283 /DNA_START=115 /DNA_END=738 /DNA_ORIENTATION=+
MAEPLKLVYWKFHGRALCVRLAAVAGNVALEDEFVSSEEFKEKKEDFVFGTLPTMKTPQGELGQSNAMLLYVAQQGGLWPQDALEAARTLELMDFGEDFYAKIGPTMRMQGAERDAARKQLAEETLPKMLGYLERHHKALGSPKYFVSDKIGVADFKLYAILQWFESGMLDGIPKDIFAQFQDVSKVYQAIAAHEAVQKHMDAWNKK